MDDLTPADRDQADERTRAERIAAEDNWLEVTVPPSGWTPLGTNEAAGEQIEARHYESGDVVFRVSAADPSLIAGIKPPLKHGFRMRSISLAEIGRSWIDEPGTNDPDFAGAYALLDNHPAVVTRQEADDRVEQSIQTALAAGWLEELDTPDGARFRLTDLGKARAAELLGVPVNQLE